MDLKAKLSEAKAKLEEMKTHRSRGFVMAQVMQTIIMIVIIGAVLVVGNVFLGQLSTVNENSLGNNSNATLAINSVFALLSTTVGIVTLIVVIILLFLGIAVMLSLGNLGGMGGGKGRGRR